LVGLGGGFVSAPLRFDKRETVDVSSGEAPGKSGEEIKVYIQSLAKMVPAEAQSLYAIGRSAIPGEEKGFAYGWITFCLAAVVLVRALGTADPASRQGPDWLHVLISCLAFLIWVYTLGGIFPEFNNAKPFIGILLTVAFTFVVPYLYQLYRDRA
jgi:L-asparagine transporter-like permease